MGLRIFFYFDDIDSVFFFTAVHELSFKFLILMNDCLRPNDKENPLLRIFMHLIIQTAGKLRANI